MTITEGKRTKHTSGLRVLLALWLMSIALVVGCGESPELKLEQAKIALANQKPQRAISIIDSLLAEDPDNQQALLIQARAQIALGRLDPAKLALDRLAKDHPDDPAVAQALLVWSQKTIDQVLQDPMFAGSIEAQARFSYAWDLAQAQAIILDSDPKAEFSPVYLRALLDRSDVARLRLLIGHTQKMIEEFGPDTPVRIPSQDAEVPGEDTDPPPTYSQQLDAMNQQLLARVEGMLVGLETALSENPQSIDTAMVYLHAVTAERSWERMFTQLQKLSEATDLPLATADRAILLLLGMPKDSPIEMPARVDLGWNLLRATPVEDAESQVHRIASARLLMAGDKTDQALPILEKLLEEGSLSADAHYLLAQSLFSKGEYERCKELTSRMFPAMENVAQVQALFGVTLWRLGEVDQAKQALRKACELDPNDPIAREAFTTLITQQGFIGASGEDVEAYYQLDPNNPRAIQFKLQYAAASGDTQAVASLLDDIESRPEHTDDQLRLLYFGNNLLGRHNAARVWAGELISRQPDELDLWIKLASTQLRQHDEPALQDTLDQIGSRFPDAPGREQLTGELYFQTHQYERAVAALGLTLEQDPDNTGVRIALARSLAAMGRFSSALTQVKAVLEINAEDVDALAMGARIAYAAGEAEQAQHYLDQIDPAKVDPVKEPALAAQLKLRQGDYDAAVQICTRAIASGNLSPMLRLVLAGVYQEKNEPEKAEEHLVALIRHYPNSAEAFAWLVQFYSRNDMTDRGIERLKEAEVYNETLAKLAQASLLRLDARLSDAVDTLSPLLDRLIRLQNPMAPSVADMVAKLHKELGDEDAANEVYDRLYAQQTQGSSTLISELINSWPTDSNARRLANLESAAARISAGDIAGLTELSRRYAMLGKADQALSIVQRGLSQSPDDQSLLSVKAGLLLILGRSSEALKMYERVIELNPQDSHVRVRYAMALSADGQHPQAEKTLTELIHNDDTVSLNARAALLEMYHSLGLSKRVSSVVSASLDKTPIGENVELDLILAQALMQMGRHDEARHRLDAIEPESIYYASAQFHYAQSEAKTGDTSAAGARVQALVGSPQTAPAAISLMLRLQPDDPQDIAILQAADSAIDIRTLPKDLVLPWLKIRLLLADQRGDWVAASGAIDRLIEMSVNDTTPMLALSVALAYQQGDLDRTKTVFDSSPRLQASSIGSLLGFALKASDPTRVRVHPMTLILEALAKGDGEALQSASEGYADIRTLFPDDLIHSIQAGYDVAKTDSACRDLAVCVVALQGNLKGLSKALAQTASTKAPGFVPADALLAASSSLQDQELPGLLRKVQADSPESSLALMIHAMLSTSQNDHAAAVAPLQALTQRHPGNKHLAYQLAQELNIAGHSEQAIIALRAIASGDGQYQLAASNDLAYVLAKQGGAGLDEAAKLARSVLKSAPDSPVVMDTAGWVEHQRSRDQRALKLLTAAIPMLKDEPEAHYHLGATYKSLGQDTWARYHLEQAASGPEDVPGVQQARDLLKQMGDATGWP